jgi:putative oxidoreductase
MKPPVAQALRLTRMADLLQPLLLLAARLYVASVFLKSGIVKVSDWGSTLALFHDEYKVPLLPPDLAAYMGTFGELVFPVFIVLGLMGRLSAAGLFVVNVMAVVSYPQLWGFDCPAGINAHFYWGSILLALVAFGPGLLSVDALIRRRFGPADAARRPDTLAYPAGG